jgi:hypothetical protein
MRQASRSFKFTYKKQSAFSKPKLVNKDLSTNKAWVIKLRLSVFDKELNIIHNEQLLFLVYFETLLK